MEKRTGIKGWLYHKLIGSVLEAREQAEQEILVSARERAFQSASGMGGIVAASFLTPRPWRYESSFWRKAGWVIYLSFFERKMSPVALPLSIREYYHGKCVIYSSGVQVGRCGNGECVTLAHAYFDPYA